MLKTILTKLTILAVVATLLGGYSGTTEHSDTANTNDGIQLCHDLDDPIEMD